MNSHLSQSFEMIHPLKFHSSPLKNDAWPFKQKKTGWLETGSLSRSIFYPRLICLSSRPKTKMRFPTRFRSMPEVEQTTSELQWSQQKRPTTLFKLKSQWNSSIFNVSFSDCLILWSCSLLSNCNLLTIVASILFFSECHVIFIKARILLKNPVIFVLSDFGWSWIPPKNLRLWPRGAWFSVPKKSCWAERNLAGWKLASRLESAFHCMPPQKKKGLLWWSWKMQKDGKGKRT